MFEWQEQGTGNSRAAIEVWEGSGQDAHDTVVHHLNLSIHRVETLQGAPTLYCVRQFVPFAYSKC